MTENYPTLEVTGKFERVDWQKLFHVFRDSYDPLKIQTFRGSVPGKNINKKCSSDHWSIEHNGKKPFGILMIEEGEQWDRIEIKFFDFHDQKRFIQLRIIDKKTMILGGSFENKNKLKSTFDEIEKAFIGFKKQFYWRRILKSLWERLWKNNQIIWIVFCLLVAIFILRQPVDWRKTVKNFIIKPLENFGFTFRYEAHKFEVDGGNIIFAKILNSTNRDGNIFIIFYNAKVINNTNENLTIKEVWLSYGLNSVQYRMESTPLITRNINSKFSNEKESELVLRNNHDLFHIGDWNNLRVEIGKNKTLLPGGVMEGSMAFDLNINDFESLYNLDHFLIEVIDFSGKKSIHDIKIEREWIERSKGFVAENVSDRY